MVGVWGSDSLENIRRQEDLVDWKSMVWPRAVWDIWFSQLKKLPSSSWHSSARYQSNEAHGKQPEGSHVGSAKAAKPWNSGESMLESPWNHTILIQQCLRQTWLTWLRLLITFNNIYTSIWWLPCSFERLEVTLTLKNLKNIADRDILFEDQVNLQICEVVHRNISFSFLFRWAN